MEIHDNFFSDANSVPQPEAPKFNTFQPLNDLVLVKRYQEDNSKAGSFIVPEKFRQQSNQGIIVALNQLFNDLDDGIKVGDKITFGIGNAETLIVNGEEHLLIRYNDIRGVEAAL